MSNEDLRQQIAAAMLANDLVKLKELKEQLGCDKWLAQFNGNIPLTAFLNPNPYIKFKD